MTLLRRYQTEIILVFVSLVWHVLCFAAVVAAQSGNMMEAVRADDGYFEVARNLLEGNGYSMATSSPHAPTSLRTPGFIYFLAGAWTLTGNPVGAAIIQLLLACAIPVLGWYITQYLTRSRRAGVIAGAILALDPTLALLSFQFYTETLFLVIFFAWLLITFRYFETPTWTTLIAGALLLGLATLTKASTQFLPFLVAACIMWHYGRGAWRQGLLHASVYIAIVVALLTPWILRNLTVFGTPGLSTQTAYVLYTNFAPAVRSVALGTDFNHEIVTFSTWEERVGAAITFQNAGLYADRAVDVIRTYPLASAYVAVKSLITFFTHDGIHALVARSGYAISDFLPLVVLARLLWIAITAFAGIGALILLFKERSLVAIFCITLVAYFALTSTIAAFGTNPRYRLPVDPLILGFAAIGITYVLERLKRVRRVQQYPGH